jgi:hypothetical protein
MGNNRKQIQVECGQATEASLNEAQIKASAPAK